MNAAQIDLVRQILQILTAVISVLTFVYVTVGGIIFKKKVVLHSVGTTPVSFKVRRKNFNVQQLTNIVSVLYYQGGILPPEVRKEIIMMTAPMAFKSAKVRVEWSGSPLLINLSNHPSSNWAKEQLDAAEAFGPIMDMPFPSIPPDADEALLAKMADEYAGKICALGCDGCPTVHIMGEMNFTFAMVKRLQEKGILCVASTTERIVEQMPDGEKKSTFKFVRFRRYE